MKINISEYFDAKRCYSKKRQQLSSYVNNFIIIDCLVIQTIQSIYLQTLLQYYVSQRINNHQLTFQELGNGFHNIMH